MLKRVLEIKEPSYTVDENVHSDIATMDNSMEVPFFFLILLRFLKKLKIELPYDLAIPLLGICPEKTIIQKDACIPVFIAALFIIAKTDNNLNAR